MQVPKSWMMCHTRVLDDTLVYLIVGDNGASAEGGLQGTFNKSIHLNGLDIETAEFLKQRISQFGGPQAYNRFDRGWDKLREEREGVRKPHRRPCRMCDRPCQSRSLHED
jgi:hypothetical protein